MAAETTGFRLGHILAQQAPDLLAARALECRVSEGVPIGQSPRCVLVQEDEIVLVITAAKSMAAHAIARAAKTRGLACRGRVRGEGGVLNEAEFEHDEAKQSEHQGDAEPGRAGLEIRLTGYRLLIQFTHGRGSDFSKPCS